MRILLTGSHSHLAQALLPKLCAHPAVSKVIGIDIRHTAFHHEKLETHTLDVRDPTALKKLHGCDALIHLAFVVLRGRTDARTMHAVNVTASSAWFGAAAEAGVKRLIHLSSASVYGSGETLTETAPLAPLPNFFYAQHKAKLENWLEQHHPQAVRLRSHVILGPHAQPLLRWLVRQPFTIKLPEPQPLLQCVHEEDVAEAVMLALFNQQAAGAYNLAAEDTFSFRVLVRRRYKMAVALPMPVAQVSLYGALKLFGVGGEQAWLAGIGNSLTLDCSRAQRELGWKPEFSAWAAIDATIPGSGSAPAHSTPTDKLRA